MFAVQGIPVTMSGFRPGQTETPTVYGAVHQDIPIEPDVVQGILVTMPGFRPGQAESPIAYGGVQQDIPIEPDSPYCVDPDQADAASLRWLGEYSEKRQAAMLQEIRAGGESARNHPLFPEKRAFRDALLIIPFLIVLAGAIGICAYHVSGDILSDIGSTWRDADFPTVAEVIAAAVAGGVVSLVVATCYTLLAKRCAACVVWTSLALWPIVSIAVGLALVGIGLTSSAGTALVFLGANLIMAGALGLTSMFCLWVPEIPFLIKLVEAVATVTNDNLWMLSAPLLGSVIGIAWTLVVAFAASGLYADSARVSQQASDGPMSFVPFAFVFVLIWGGFVANNICCVTCCGVFGRWYCKKDDGTQVRESLKVALTTSFGSVCLGSLLIAPASAVEVVVRQMRRAERQEGGVFPCVLLRVVECFISCLGNSMEYFGEWACVQVAVRGVSCYQAARITFSMCSCANVLYILKDLLLDTLVCFGALLCAASGALVCGSVGYAMGGLVKAAFGALIGLWSGLVAGGSAMCMFSSGLKTIVALWAEAPEILQLSHPAIHSEFEQKVKLEHLRAKAR